MKKESNPLLSIIVPIYNVEKYLDRCIKSLVNQELKDIEIILVDDESPDNCPAICDEYKKSDTRIKVIHKKNEGLGFARNSGIEIAKGKYIAFVDSDDFVEINMYKELCDIAMDNKCDAVISGFNKMYNNGVIVEKKEVDNTKVFRGKDNINQLVLDMIGSLPEDKKDYKYEMSVWRGIYSNEVIKKNKIRFPSEREYISEDIVFHIDYFEKCDGVAIVPKCYYYYCENNTSLTTEYKEDRYEKNKILYYFLKNKIETNNYKNNNCNLYLDRFILSRARVAISQILSVKNKRKKIDYKNLIKSISNDNLIKEVLKRYPINKLPKQQYIFNLLLKYQMIGLLDILVKINKIKKKVFFS